MEGLTSHGIRLILSWSGTVVVYGVHCTVVVLYKVYTEEIFSDSAPDS